MTARYFRLWCRLDARDAYLVWCSEPDGVLADNAHKVPAFREMRELESHSEKRGIVLVEGSPRLHDLDSTARWIASGSSESIDCDNLLTAWNLFSDVSRSVGGDFDADESNTEEVYLKLFYGSSTANEILRPREEPVFAPVWSRDQFDLLRSTLERGLLMFRRVLSWQ
jgi:hypothetical protein